jgi:hypothetical protein
MSKYTVSDILEAREAQKKTKHFLDKLPTKKNKTRGLAADDKAKIARLLPSKKEEFKKAEKLSRLFDTTARAGAGGTRTGVPGIRPSGGKEASGFLETYTGVGRYKAPPAAFTQNQSFTGSATSSETKRPSVVLYKKCMDCMQPVRRDDAIPNMTIIPASEHLHPIAREKWETVKIRPGSIICYLFCGDCVRAAVAVSKDPSKQIRLISGGQETTLARYELQQRSQKISDQVFEAIKRERDNPESDVFYSDGVLD